ncbi:MAG: hypothetical protein O6761_07860 [Thaumarchaeota archaeon]|nr:hypothetical protein [Nitrososphaerota archaeon]
MCDLTNEILTAYLKKFPDEFVSYNNIGAVFTNYITTEKQKAAMKLLEFALDYLKEKK